MPKSLSHEEITQRFVDAKVVDFTAMGRVIAELGPTLATADQGLHGVITGRFSTLACMIPAADAARLVGGLRGAAAANAALDGALEAALGK